MRAVGNL